MLRTFSFSVMVFCRVMVALVLLFGANGVAMAQDAAFAIDPLSSLPLDKKMKLAKAGDDEAKFAVGEAYELGLGTTPDLFSAAKWYRDVALKGNLEAQYRLARIVRDGAKGLRKDLPAAVTLFADAAAKSHPGAQFEMGVMSEAGLSVDKSDEKAIEWYDKAAGQGHAGAMRNLGLMYVFGRGTKTDAKKAAQLFQKAADLEDGWAANNLAGLYEQGWGVPQDVAKARALYVRAVGLGIVTAETNIKRLDAAP
jgi:uncharacterized protein